LRLPLSDSKRQKNFWQALKSPIRFLKPKDLPQFGLSRAKEMYGLARKEIERLEFLTKPAEFIDSFEGILE